MKPGTILAALRETCVEAIIPLSLLLRSSLERIAAGIVRSPIALLSGLNLLLVSGMSVVRRVAPTALVLVLLALIWWTIR